MDSDDEFQGDKSEMRLIAREWEKRSQSIFKEGFVQGSTAGQNQSLQTAFNAGFKQGFLSRFLLAKIKGILNALVAYQMNYEGHPITESTILEAHSLLDEIRLLEENSIAEDFLKLTLNQSANGFGITNDLISDFSKVSTRQIHDTGNDVELDEFDTSPAGVDLTLASKLTVERVNEILLECPSIKLVVDRCKCILKTLKWSDDTIDKLL